uniref:Uncharacterized protein n=1 Tax=Periophthalmus magnuspinnatus TaxID=409849 RepID=A0A3B4AZH3_9GOBI
MTISNRMPLGEQLILEVEENPFAEYMWMENEEEFDRQFQSSLNPNAKEFTPGIQSHIM